MAAEKITDLAEFLKENASITQPDESYGTILIALVRQFKSVLSVREMACGLCSIGAQILQDGSDYDKFLREAIPKYGGHPENN